MRVGVDGSSRWSGCFKKATNVKESIQKGNQSSFPTPNNKMAASTMSMKPYTTMETNRLRLPMRPVLNIPAGWIQPQSPPLPAPTKSNFSLQVDEHVPSQLDSSIIYGDERFFSGAQQFQTSYRKNFGTSSPDHDELYTSTCDNYRTRPKPAARTPVQMLAFHFANKVNASRGFESLRCGGGGKSPTRRAFEAMDVNGDRQIDREELLIAVQRMGFESPEQEVMDEFFGFLAGSNGSHIDYPSFSTAIDTIPPNLRACW